MKKASHKLADDLGKRYKLLERSRIKIESLYKSGHVSKTMVLQVYEGLFLNARVGFEGFLETLFFGLLVRDYGVKSSRPEIKPRIEVRTHKIAKEVIQDKRQYVDWFPYQENTLRLAEIYFVEGRPFSELSNNQKQTLSKCHATRNVVAHRSAYSLRKFENVVLGSLLLISSERTPAGYLRSLFRASPNQTRLENFMAELLIMARQLAR